MRERLRDFSDLTTVMQGLLALSSAGFLAVVVQALADAFLGLSTIERALLGVCLFLLLLALFLSQVKVFRDRRASGKSDLERLSADLRETQEERDRLREKLEPRQHLEHVDRTSANNGHTPKVVSRVQQKGPRIIYASTLMNSPTKKSTCPIEISAPRQLSRSETQTMFSSSRWLTRPEEVRFGRSKTSPKILRFPCERV